MTSDVGRLNVVATFTDMKRARAAIDSLQFGGFDPLNIALLGAGARDAERELNARTNTTPSDGGIAARLVLRAALGGIAGLVLGALLGVVVASFGLSFIPSLDSYLAQAGAYGLYAAIAGTLLGGMSGISQGDAWELTYAADGDVRSEIAVSVHSSDQSQIDHAEAVLRGETPIGVERFADGSPPPIVREHLRRQGIAA